MTDKMTIRRTMSERRRSLDLTIRRDADSAINVLLTGLKQIVDADTVGFYLSDGTEPSLETTLEYCLNAGKKVFVPRYRRERDAGYEMVEIHHPKLDTAIGVYGLLEPLAHLPGASEAELMNMVWLVPGMAFDRSGNRLGRGKGIYDRLLVKTAGCRIGIYYSFQEISSIPCETHDEKLDLAVTENAIIQFNG